MKPTNRSEFVHADLHHIPNRFALCRYAAKATRAIHVRGDRVQDTTNKALAKTAPKRGVAAIFGTWPGDETEQELLAQLAKLRRQR